MGWIGIDLDGTLAHDEGKDSISGIGRPIAPMVERVRHLVAAGQEVRIFTARVSPASRPDDWDPAIAEAHIRAWCARHLGFELPVTCMKDQHMTRLFDDRAVQVQRNTGVIIVNPYHLEAKP
jgi:hypothetical protein